MRAMTSRLRAEPKKSSHFKAAPREKTSTEVRGWHVGKGELEKESLT
jgi:hypothetical protein